MATATFLTLKNVPFGECGDFDCRWWFFFAVSLIRDSSANFLIAFPLLFMAWRIGIKNVLSFISIAAVGALPVAYVLANPLTFAWTPADKDFVNGSYWLVPGIYVLFSSTTGLLFDLVQKALSQAANIRTSQPSAQNPETREA